MIQRPHLDPSCNSIVMSHETAGFGVPSFVLEPARKSPSPVLSSSHSSIVATRPKEQDRVRLHHHVSAGRGTSAEGPKMLSRRSFLNSTLGAGAGMALAAQGARPAAAQLGGQGLAPAPGPDPPAAR